MNIETKHDLGDEVIYWSEKDAKTIRKCKIKAIIIYPIYKGYKVFYRVERANWLHRPFNYEIIETDLFKSKEDILKSL